MLDIGRVAPFFEAPTHTNPTFKFSSVGGRYAVLAFLPPDAERAGQMTQAVSGMRHLLSDDRVVAFFVTSDENRFRAAGEAPGLRWFFDANALIANGYGALEADGSHPGRYVVIDPAMRILAWLETDEALRSFIEALPAPDDHAGVTLFAPVLVVPRVFEPELCRRLIDLYDARGGERSGVMREVDGRTVPVLDSFKSRRDVVVDDQALRDLLRQRLAQRLLPQIHKAFNYKVTRVERYMVACYDAAEGGYFNAHRDNTTRGTAHRRFACSINLNAEDFEGGDLRFPEFGSRTYRPPTGGAVVFSCSLLHEATLVRSGRRYAFLPFFFDEDAEKIRLENLKFLDQAPAA
ncbi:2OG-Fe(II) oxygenase [Phenylobacterium conjunctum]|uniref:2OG-Fe(II) oxygenase n=1 Tax=Phenylobacterium conjunctum TaxID=1298959 RepID=A0ABW3T6W4_9CAUL